MAAAAHPDANTTLITLMFPLNIPRNSEGPPFPLSVDLYHELLDDQWTLVHIEDVDKSNGRHTGPAGDEKLGIWKWKA